jgi:hypothetical protein
MKDETRVFFVVDSVDTNEELFETLEIAQWWAADLLNRKKQVPRIRVAIVKHAFMDDGVWNYDDQADTFQFVHTIQI